jgi:acyl-CoA thioesterase FadM
MYFRLLRVLLSGLFKERLYFNDNQYQVLEFRVAPTDLDIWMHMNNGKMMTMLDLGKLDLMWRYGLLKPQFQRKFQGLLGTSETQFKKALSLGNKITMKTRFLGIDENNNFVIEQILEHKGKLVLKDISYSKYVDKRKSLNPYEVIQHTFSADLLDQIKETGVLALTTSNQQP